MTIIYLNSYYNKVFYKGALLYLSLSLLSFSVLPLSPLTDCPQVQCVTKYVPKEPDELALEESDVVNVFKKLEDGKFFSHISMHTRSSDPYVSSLSEKSVPHRYPCEISVTNTR